MATVLKYANRLGFPCIESKSTSLTDTALTYSFDSYIWVNPLFRGGIFIKISNTPTAPETAVPVYFTSDSNQIAVQDKTGTALTTDDITDGIYIAFYQRGTNSLQILNV